MRKFLEELEKRCGNIADLADVASRRILTGDRLQNDHLQLLFTNEACCVHVKNFFSREGCKDTVEALKALKEKRLNWSVSHATRGQEKSDVDALGVPFNVANARGKSAVDDYFLSSLDVTRHLRQDGKMSVIDKFRLELDETWKDGCRLSTEKDTGRKFSPAICRIMKPGFESGSRGFIHVDDLDILNPAKGLFSYNIYLQKPEIGGEINIWPVSIKSRKDFYCNAATLSLMLVQDKESQDLLYKLFPPPTTINVQEGDLILINTQRPHAVKKPLIGSRERISFQGFIQYKKGEPLLLEV